ncbi:MAG: MBL fold metallo-hydrolase [Candidatus Saccharibacteria bacterium]|nr:MBL fold metallo-hydrolase [Candidatus Saccharibacteria bacterium]
MKITKYEHACLVVEQDGHRLVVDPGEFSQSLPELTNVVGIIITHVHFDHLDEKRIQAIVTNNPGVKIFSVAQVKEKLEAATVCHPGDEIKLEPFTLKFYGEMHATIHPDYPMFENIGVSINDTLFYGGDSLDHPDVPACSVLAVPTSGPWSKTSDQMDYMVNRKPKIAIAVHDFLSSEAGNDSQDRWLGIHAQKYGIDYKHLAIGESLEV